MACRGHDDLCRNAAALGIRSRDAIDGPRGGDRWAIESIRIESNRIESNRIESNRIDRSGARRGAADRFDRSGHDTHDTRTHHVARLLVVDTQWT